MSIMGLLSSEQLNQLKLVLDTLSKNQLIWLSGYLLGLVNSQTSTDIGVTASGVSAGLELKPDLIDNTIIVISASQTGNARNIAKQLYSDLVEAGLRAVLFSAGEYKFKKISEISLLIFITSTHGEGEPPEEALALYKYLFSEKALRMEKTSFIVLSLGDRSYEYFAKAGKDFDKRFEDLGANRLYDRVDLDVDFQSEVDKWKEKVVSLCKSKIVSIVSKDKCINIQNNIVFKKKNPVTSYCKEFPLIAYLLNRQKITSCNSLKDVHHLEFDISGSGLCYQPGDALGIWYENDYNLVYELLELLNLTGRESVQIKNQSMCLDEALVKYCDLTQNTPVVVKSIATISQDKILLNLLQNQNQLNSFCSTTPIVEMFYQISMTKQLSSQELIQILRPMRPRFYSIASAQSEVGEEIHITVSVVRYTINGRIRSGGASSYLVDRVQDHDEIRIFVESNDNFRLPKDPNVSIIMIGAGTGIAPFRSFMQQRALDKALGKNWLFFGNLKFTDDFLYQIEWKTYFKSGILNKIDTAWSRDQDYKVYVQDKLLSNGLELWDWIQKGAYIYVCGDAKYMARDVEQALVTVVSIHGNMNMDQSNDFWNEMRVQHRYQRDIY
ncbi:sulfite reductase (NADPH) flavoprotein beta subunit [Candidatus Blochmanniella floridana]|uniref:Sulfite reductase [NADPH] flavoprotein alpha-component n=1 Tax=Blochmanniella floridana TaxID=203907 RepID=CYSJ_BLOFL|nr:RecName: Full=Sulfite reductase [NADPH] flavoprotein alpha-component; Short=SiR-FP [Candidatus Blochmannia floridanus]CAD83679.1 sulfite reductase (NADPH) flavoprotein beta subunit [Candidatus Blochmannia floridanus]